MSVLYFKVKIDSCLKTKIFTYDKYVKITCTLTQKEKIVFAETHCSLQLQSQFFLLFLYGDFSKTLIVWYSMQLCLEVGNTLFIIIKQNHFIMSSRYSCGDGCQIILKPRQFWHNCFEYSSVSQSLALPITIFSLATNSLYYVQ